MLMTSWKIMKEISSQLQSKNVKKKTPKKLSGPGGTSREKNAWNQRRKMKSIWWTHWRFNVSFHIVEYINDFLFLQRFFFFSFRFSSVISPWSQLSVEHRFTCCVTRAPSVCKVHRAKFCSKSIATSVHWVKGLPIVNWGRLSRVHISEIGEIIILIASHFSSPKPTDVVSSVLSWNQS